MLEEFLGELAGAPPGVHGEVMLFGVPLKLCEIGTDSYFFTERLGEGAEQRDACPLAAQIQLRSVEVRHYR